MNKVLKFKVVLYEEDGTFPIENFLRDLPLKTRAKVSAMVSLLEEKGNEMPFEYSKKLKGSPLWELKISHGTNIYRIFYFFSKRLIILVHGFSKKTDDTPKSDLELAEKRMNEWRGKNENV
jgi:phage-related protein